jgi:hypothetical protein
MLLLLLLNLPLRFIVSGPRVLLFVHRQVRTIFPVGSQRGTAQPPTTHSAAFAFSLLGPGSHACGQVGRDHRWGFALVPSSAVCPCLSACSA